jgi:hypothetical protein
MVSTIVRGSCSWLLLVSLLSSVPSGATANVHAAQHAQIRPASTPAAPFEPSSPQRVTRSSSAPFIIEIVHARVLVAAAAAAVFVLTPTPRVGPGEAHVRLVERPPIAPLFAT